MRARSRCQDGSLTAERLRSLFDYNPKTGRFIRRMRSGSAMAGSLVGTQRKDGRWQVSIDGAFYLASRLVWLYVHGEWPTGEIDHRDRDKSNDRIDNLRDATHAQNIANRTKFAGRSKYIGVSQHHTGKWLAEVMVDGVRHREWGFDTQEEAAAARDARMRTDGFSVPNL